jgi:hypothetical protein
MSRTIKKGAVDQSIYLEILDSTSTSGARKTGLVFNTAGLTAYYVRNGASATSITLATLAAANSAHSDGGFKEVDATNMPGIYRLDLPDAAVGSGAESVVVTVKGATGAAQVSSEIQLVDNVEADTFARLGAPAGASIAADLATIDDFIDTEVSAIKSKTDNLPSSPAAVGSAMTLTSGERDSVADALLDRNMATGTDSGSPTVRTVRQALRFLRNKWAISGGTLSVKKEDDSTDSWTAAITATPGADPVTGSDPA